MTTTAWTPSQSDIDQLHRELFEDEDHDTERWNEEECMRAIVLINEALARSPVYLNACASSWNRETLLTCAAEKQALPLMEHLLNAGADPNIQNGKYQTALMIAAIKGFEKGIALLLDRGARVDIRAADGRGALLNYAGAYNTSASTYELMLDAGASPLEIDADGYLAFHRHVSGSNPDLKSLYLLIQGVSPTVVNGRVGKHGGNSLYLVNGEKSIVFPVVQCLVDHGADPAYTNWTGSTALHCAIERSAHPGTVDALVRIGVDINAQDCAGRTALHLACKALFDMNNDDYLRVVALIELGAYVDIKDVRGVTPMQLLAEKDERYRHRGNGNYNRLMALARAAQAHDVIENMGMSTAPLPRPL